MRKPTKYYNAVNRRFYLLVGFVMWMGFMTLLVLGGEVARLMG